MRSIALTLALPLLAADCVAQISEMPTFVGFDEDNVEGGNDAAVVVLKVEPPAEILLAAGCIGPQGWRGTGPKNRAWLSARGGFVVAKVTPTQDDMAYAVVQVRPQPVGTSERTAPTYETAFWSIAASGAAATPGGNGPAYGPGDQARIPLVEAVAGRVVFAGTLRIDALAEPGAGEAPQKVAITPVTSSDLGEVSRFMAQRYPKVRARILPRPLQMMRMREGTD